MNEQVDSLLRSIGPRLTAVCLGLTDARKLVGYRDGIDELPSDVADRLEVTRRFVKTFTDSGDTAAVAAAYLRGSWPDFGDRAPALLIREGGPGVWVELVAAAVRVADGQTGF